MEEITKELVELAAKGNQYAIEDLYRLTYSAVCKTVRSMIGQEDAVLDIVQDSYIKGFQSLDQLDAPENYRAWMKRIAVNKAKDYLKKKKPILFSEMAGEDGEELDLPDDRLEYDPEKILDRWETKRLMKEILDTLSEDQRMVIGMYYYEDMSVRQIARMLGCSENTVKSRLSYGRKNVGIKVKELEKRGTKLYSLAPVPFLLWLFRMDAKASEIPSAAVLEAITAECASGSAAAAGAGSAARTGGKTAAGGKAAAGAGVKALTAKITAGVLAVAVAGGGAVLAISANDRGRPQPTQLSAVTETGAPALAEPVETAVPTARETVPQLPAETLPPTPEQTLPAQTVSAAGAEEAYQAVTAEYQAVMGADSTAFLNNPETYFHGEYAAVRYYHMYRSDHFCRAYADLDGNGIQELLIGFGNEGWIRIVDLYGFDGDRAVQLLYEPALADRAQLTLLTDGTLCLFAAGSAEEASQSYWKVAGCALESVSASSAQEATDIAWQVLAPGQTAAEESPFSALLADMRSALNVSGEEYEGDMGYYDALYAHLGEGAMWELTHRNFGAYTMGIWYAWQDMDGDGEEDLAIGRGLGPDDACTIRIYTRNGDVIFGDAVYTYTQSLYGGSEPTGWNYLGG